MTHPALQAGHTAVITGGAAGIGLAVARRLADLGLNICLADRDAEALDRAQATLAGAPAVMAERIDVADPADLQRLEAAVHDRFGGAEVVMNNAGIQPGSDIFGPDGAWERILGVNLWGVIHGCRAFVPGMIARGRPGLVINTGSKQGITCPPGDPAYNLSKAGVKVFTEALEHHLRNESGGRVTAHLLIPGFVFTGLTAQGRTAKPAGAWTPDQTADFTMDRLAAGDFYILCPDNDVSRPVDERRILWAAGDIVENRPPLSRWHPDFADAFAEFAKRN